MILLKYSEPMWLVAVFFGILAIAAITVIYIAGRPANKEEKRLMRIYQESRKKPSARTEGKKNLTL